MPLTDPFAVIGGKRGSAAMYDAPPDDESSSVPEDAATPFSTALQRQRVQAPADLAADQQQQATELAAQQKSQDQQNKIAAENLATQDKVDATNLKAAGAVTQPTAVPGPDGRTRIVQQQQTNPDGTPAYQPADLGIKTAPNGDPFSVSRNQWGAQQWNDPYSATRANLKVTPTGQIMATPKGKGAGDLPAKDVTDVGVSGLDSTNQQGPRQTPGPDLTVAPNAPMNQPQVRTQVDAEEQKLVQAAALQRIKETVGKDADDAVQAQADAKADHESAQAALAEAKANAKTSMDPDQAQKDVTAAQSLADQKRNAYIAAGRDAAAKRNIHQQAQADPLGFLQMQEQAASSPSSPISGPAQQPDNGAASVPSSSSPQPGSNPSGTQAASAPPTSPAPNSPVAGAGPDSPEAQKAAGEAEGDREVAAANAAVNPPAKSSVLGDLVRRFVAGVGQGTGQAIEGLAHAGRYVSGVQALNDAVNYFAPGYAPNDIEEAAGKALTGKAAAIGKGGLSYGSLGTMATDPARDKDISSQLASGAGSMVPLIASGPAASAVGAAQMAQQYKDAAAAKGRSPEQQEIAFGVGALTGAAIQKVAGFVPILHEAQSVPALLTTKTAAGVLKDLGVSTAKNVARSAAEGTVQSGGEQAATADYSKGITLPTSKDLMDDGSMVAQNAVLSGILGPAFRGLGIADAKAKVSSDLDTINQARADALKKNLADIEASDASPQDKAYAKDQARQFHQPITRDDYVKALLAQEQARQTAIALAQVTKAHANIDADANLSPEQKDAAKQKTMGKLDPAIRPVVQKHLDDASEAQRQINAVLDQAKQAAKGASDPAQIAAIQEQAGQAVDAIHNNLKASMQTTNDLAATPEGRTAIDQLNQYNAKLPPGVPKADSRIIQKAGDLAPKTAEGEVPPTTGHYLPVTHQIEQLPNADQRTMATAAVKLVNGRALNSSEQGIMFGDPDAQTPPAVDAVTKQPFAVFTNGKPVLTDAGLARLRALVPAASDILPRNEQAQMEAPVQRASVPVEKKSRNSDSVEKPPVQPTPKTGANFQPPAMPPDPGLAKTDDETLQVQHDNVSAAIARAKERGGDAPPTVYAHRDRLAAEIARRRAAIVSPEVNPIGARAGAKEGDEIDYTRPGPDGKPITTRGEVTEVQPTHYRVVDTQDGVERTVPLIRETQGKDERKNENSDVSGKMPAEQREVSPGTAPESDRETNAEEAGERSEINLPGFDTSKVVPEHQEAAGLLSSAYAKMKPVFDALGFDPETFQEGKLPDGTIGVGVAGNKVMLDLPRLAANLARLDTPGKRRLRVEALIEEEAIHAAVKKLLGAKADTMMRDIWRSLTPEQQKKVIEEYGGYLDGETQGNDALDALRGHEYMRMLVQLERSGRTTEWSNKLSGPVTTYLRAALHALRKILTPGNEAVKNLAQRVQNILDKGGDDNLDLSPPKDEPPPGKAPDEVPVPHLDLSHPSDEEVAARDQAHKEMMTEAFGDRDSLLDAVKKAGGIPTTDPALQGELNAVKEGKNKGVMVRLFRKSAQPLDRLREALGEKGFHFETPAQMLDGILDSVRSGKPVYGSAVDQAHADRLQSQIEAMGKPAQELTPIERKVVVNSAKRISEAADGLRSVLTGSAIHEDLPNYPGPLAMPGMLPGVLDGAQREVEAKFAKWVQADPDRAAAEYARIPDAEGGRVIDMDIARHLSPDYRDTKHSRTIYSPAVQKVVNALANQKLLLDAGKSLRAGETMGMTAGGPGSGKGNIKKILPDEWYGAKFVHDSVLRHIPDAENLIRNAKAVGAKSSLWYVHVPVEKAVDQAVGRTEHDGRSLPLKTLASGHFQAQQTFIHLLQKYAGDPAVDLKVIDNSGKDPVKIDQPLSFLQNERILYRDADEVEQRARQAFEGQAHRLTDPDALSIYREGKTVSQLGRDLQRNGQAGKRDVGSANGSNAGNGAETADRPSESGQSTGTAPDAAGPAAEADRPLSGAEIADHPDVERPLAKYVEALRQGELSLGKPVDFAREYETDMGQPAPESLVARAKELEVQPGEADQAPGKTPEELFHNHLDLADRLAGKFDNIPGFQPDDARQVARVALQKAAGKYNPTGEYAGVPFRGYAPAIIRNALRDAYRTQARRAVEQPTLDRPLDAEEPGETGKDLVESPGKTSAQEVAQRDAHGQLRDYISRVSMAPESRRALQGVLDGKSQVEIAKDFGVSEQRVTAMVGSGLEQLRKLFAEKGIDRGDLLGGAAIRDTAARPPNDIRTDREASLTPDELRAEYNADVARIKSNSILDSQQKGARLKAEGMRFAAKMRFATGNLTSIEAAEKARFESSNYQGKPVSVDGREATVVGPVFGKVKVSFSDGTTRTVPAEDIQDAHMAVHGAAISDHDALVDSMEAMVQHLEDQEGVPTALVAKAQQLADEVRRRADEVNLSRASLDNPHSWPQEWRDEYERARRAVGIPDGTFDHPKLPDFNRAFDSKHQPEIEAAKDRAVARSKETISGAAVADEPKTFARDALGFKAFVHGDVVPTAKEVGKLFADAHDGLLQTWHPQGRGDEAAWTARTLQAKLGEIAIRKFQTEYAFRQARALFNGKQLGEKLAFIDAIEKGTKIADPALEQIAQRLRETNAEYVAAARKVPSKQFRSFIENYFPHIWKQGDYEAAQKFYQRKVEGSRAFLKHRAIPTIAEGIEAGFRLQSDNPVDLFLTRWAQMDKFIAAQHMIDEGKQAGMFKEFRNEAEVIPGYVKIDPKIGYSTEEAPDQEAIDENRRARENPELFPSGRKDRPETMQRYVPLYAPEAAAGVINNYLSPGLRNHANAAISGAYRALTGTANVLNSAQLGLSAFHLGFTTVDTMVSKLALAMEQAVAGKPVDAMKSAMSLPITPVTNFLQGDKLLKELRSPGSQGAEMALLAQAVTQAGGRAGLDPLYSDQWCKAFTKALGDGNYFGAGIRMPFAAIEAGAKPIMEWMVPRQKLGVFADLARQEMDKLGPNASLDDTRKAMQKAWASVDNRMGQLVYDNLHWNKVAKDAALVSIRSVGWNLGTFREIGGGLVDFGKEGFKLATGKEAEFTHRMAYVLALHTLLAGMGTMTGYLMTGQWPQSLTDIFFPRTGEKDANGHDVRISFPSYVKDEAAYWHAPVQTLENKANPLMSGLFNLYNNKDYYGTQIRNPDDPIITQAGDMMRFAGRQFLPFSVTGGTKFASANPPPADSKGIIPHVLGSGAVHTLLKGAPTLGLTPASAYLSTSAAEQRAQDIEDRLHSGETRDKDEAVRSQKYVALRNQFAQNDPMEKGISPEEQTRRQKMMAAALQQATRDGTIKPGGAAKLVEAARKPPLQRSFENIIREFQMKGDSRNAYKQAKSIWDIASPSERKLLAVKMAQIWGTVRTRQETTDPNPVTSQDKK